MDKKLYRALSMRITNMSTTHMINEIIQVLYDNATCRIVWITKFVSICDLLWEKVPLRIKWNFEI